MDRHRDRFPWFCLILVVLNIGAFFLTTNAELQLRRDVALRYGFVPSQFWSGSNRISMLTHMFLHAGPSHIVFNMIALLFLGSVLESRAGSSTFLGIYIASGVLGALVFALLFPLSSVPAVGASAAIFGVMGALALLFPTSIVYLFLLPLPVMLVAVLYAFALITVVQTGEPSRAADLAHLAGMVGGMGMAFLVRPDDAIKGLLAFLLCLLAISIMIQIL